MKKVLLICVMAAMVMSVLSAAPAGYSAMLNSTSPHDGKSDVSHQEGYGIGQEWSLQGTTMNASPSKSTSQYLRLAPQANLLLSKPNTNGIHATISVEPAVSGHIYISNLSLRF